MAEWPTFGEIRDLFVNQFSCRQKGGGGELTLNGEPIRWLERVVEDQMLRHVVTYEDDTPISPRVLRSLCAKLRIDPAEVGLPLDHLDDSLESQRLLN